jgi:hypothetical protein
VLDRDTAIQLTLEDNVFEALTAIFFLVSAIFFVRNFLVSKNLYFLALAIVFTFGAGEEISWGQRLFGFETPESIDARNRQNEFNLHNLDIFHPQEEGGISKSGLSKLLTIDFLFNLFWLSWCIIIPVLNYVEFFKKIISKLKIPVPALILGMFFLLNFAIFYLTRTFTSTDKSDMYYMRYREIFECCTGIIFMLIAWEFHKRSKSAGE